MSLRKVAIAGGTSNIAREVIDRMLARKKVQVIVLTRKASDTNLPEGVTVTEIDYDDPASLANALQGVHTVISFLAIFDIQKFASTQITLVDACIANGVKRFAPSEWATCKKGEPAHYQAKVLTREYIRKINNPVKKIECCFFQPGFFTNYLATTRPTTKHFHMQDMMIDFANRRVLQPDNGDFELVFTTVEDTAEVTARAVEYDGEWPEIGGMTGQKMTVAEIVKIGEELRGPFDVCKVSYADCKAGKADLPWVPLITHHGLPDEGRLEISKRITLAYMTSVVEGGWCVSDEWNRLLPDFEFTTAEEYVRKVWGD